MWGSGKSFTQASGDLPGCHAVTATEACTFLPPPQTSVLGVAHLAACGQAVLLLELGIVLTDIHRRPPGGGVPAPGPSARLPGREL